MNPLSGFDPAANSASFSLSFRLGSGRSSSSSPGQSSPGQSSPVCKQSGILKEKCFLREFRVEFLQWICDQCNVKAYNKGEVFNELTKNPGFRRDKKQLLAIGLLNFSVSSSYRI